MMTYEDIAVMKIEDVEKHIKNLLAIAQTVAILGAGMTISRNLAEAATKYLEGGAE